MMMMMNKHYPYHYKSYLIHQHPVFKERMWVEKQGFKICSVPSDEEARKQIDYIVGVGPMLSRSSN